jgi:hypothetical protein
LTEKELNQLHWINKEIEVLKRQKEELESKSYIKGQEITDMPFGTGTTNKTCDRAVAMQELNELYEIKLKELYLVRGRIERYINSIDDAELRLILRLRCINNMNWDNIGDEIGMDRRTASRKYFRHIKESKTCPQCP